jgi:hypothetical protein
MGFATGGGIYQRSARSMNRAESRPGENPEFFLAVSRARARIRTEAWVFGSRNAREGPHEAVEARRMAWRSTPQPRHTQSRSAKLTGHLNHTGRARRIRPNQSSAADASPRPGLCLVGSQQRSHRAKSPCSRLSGASVSSTEHAGYRLTLSPRWLASVAPQSRVRWLLLSTGGAGRFPFRFLIL